MAMRKIGIIAVYMYVCSEIGRHIESTVTVKYHISNLDVGISS